MQTPRLVLIFLSAEPGLGSFLCLHGTASPLLGLSASTSCARALQKSYKFLGPAFKNSLGACVCACAGKCVCVLYEYVCIRVYAHEYRERLMGEVFL